MRNLQAFTQLATFRVRLVKVSKGSFSQGDVQIEFDDLGSKKNLYFDTRLLWFIGPLRFDQKVFFNTLSGFIPYWD